MASTNYIDGEAENLSFWLMINDFSFLTLIASICYVQNGQNHFAALALMNITISISTIQLSKFK